MEYSAGKRNGKEQRFYPNERVADETNWKDDIRVGAWTQYFDNGQLKFVTTYVNNKIEGEYKSYYPDGTKEIEGFYHDDLPHSDWKYYDTDGKYLYTRKYERGVITNQEELEKAGHSIYKNFMEPEQYIPEPTLEDFFNER